MEKMLRPFSLVVICLAASCSTVPEYHATVSSPHAAAQIITATRSESAKGVSVVLVQVDDQRVLLSSKSPLLVDPGDRSLKLRCQHSALFAEWYADTMMSIHLEAGHTYQPRCEQNEHQFTAWLEDMTTHADASTRETIQAEWSFPLIF